MGLGDMLTNVFGGGNDYRYQLPPTAGNYSANNQKFNAGIGQAGQAHLPQNVLNFKGANQSMGWQNDLIDQLIAQGQGQGPNPAMNQLRMTTDQNVNQAAGFAASQRGVNPALAARMAGQQMGQMNQQAAGQGALMGAQQQLAAQNQLQSVLGQRIGQQSQNAIAQGQAGLGLMQQRGALEAQRRQAQQNYQNMISQVYGDMNRVNAGVSAQNAQTSGMYGQGAMSGLSSAAQGAALMNEGGQVNPFKNHVAQKLAAGGTAGAYLNFQGADPMNQFMGVSDSSGVADSTSGISQGLADVFQNAFQPQSMSGASIMPGMGKMEQMPTMSEGGKILGKAQVQGNSESNDIVPAMLSPGEVVIPRTAMQSPEEAHAFLDRIIQKQEGPNFKKILQAKEKYHNMAHGGEINSCGYCNGGMAYA